MVTVLKTLIWSTCKQSDMTGVAEQMNKVLAAGDQVIVVKMTDHSYMLAGGFAAQNLYKQMEEKVKQTKKA